MHYTDEVMLVILKSRNAEAARNYFDTSLRLGDYYREGENVVGRWHGQAAARLGLVGDVTRKAFCALIDNRHPSTGEQLTPRMKADRVPGFDFTFTAPKSVSVLYAMTGDERITEALRSSVADAMAEVEREMKTRVRVRGKDGDRVTGNMVWAEFLHHTARPIGGIPDPHLHIHAYAMNLTYDGVEKRWKAAQIGDIKGEALYYEAVFHAALAKRLAEMGYGIERQGRFFEIVGADRALLDKFSQRRDIVERAALAEGSDQNPEAKRLLSRLTRERKAEAVTVEQLRDIWKARLLPRERAGLDRVVALARHGLSPTPQADARWLMGVELGESLRHQSAVSEKSVLLRVLQRGFGALVSGDARAAMELQGVMRGEVGGRRWITTAAAHTMEQQVIEYARSGRNRCAPLALRQPIRADWLNSQQQAAVRHVWHSQDRVMIVRGGAGVGKTTLMSEAVAGLTAAGNKCFVFASTIPATEVLRAEGFKSAQTVQRLIASREAQAEIGDNAVVWVDEAGLVDMATMAALFTLANQHHWRVVLSGDERQHTPVLRGDSLRLLQQRAHLPVAEVSEIVRQRGEYKRAVQSIEGGNVLDGWKKLEAMGAVIESQGPERIERLAVEYIQAVKAGETVLVVAPTHRERSEVNAEIRVRLRREGMIKGEPREWRFLRNLYWGSEAKTDAERYKGAMVVRFRQNAPGIVAGEEFEVEGVSDQGKLFGRDREGRVREIPLTYPARFEVYQPETRTLAAGEHVRMVERCPTADGGELTKGSFHVIDHFTKDGDAVTTRGHVVPRTFAFMDHGYSSTSISSQGLTVDRVLLAMGAASVPAMSQEQFYVSASRGRRQIRVFVDDVKEVREAVQWSSARPSAHDLVEGRIAAEDTRAERLRAWRRRLNRVAERMARERGAELDAGLLRDAREEALIEYQGRVRSHAAELGD